MKVSYSNKKHFYKNSDFKGLGPEVTFDMDKWIFKYNNHGPPKSFNFEKMVGRGHNLKSKLPIKELLLDQSIIAGLGNIYVNEVLFASKINPLKKGEDISLKECQSIIDNSISILNKAIEYGGTTIKSYTSSLGVTGHYQDYLKVHKREGLPCEVCNNPIINIKVGGRSTYYCPKCQK